MSLQDALQSLSEAHGPKALLAAFDSLQGRVRRARKAFTQQYGMLAQTYLEAMKIWDADKADGVPREERARRLEKSLRASWPQTREWKFLCNECGDLGLVYYECSGGSECGRMKKHLPHSYGRPCFCSKGAAFKSAPKPEATDYKQAGFSKVGRR